jgi:hypothetical protein
MAINYARVASAATNSLAELLLKNDEDKRRNRLELMRVRSQITMQAANIGMENPGQATLGDVAEYTSILYNEQKKRNDAEYLRWQEENTREDRKWEVEQRKLAHEEAGYDAFGEVTKAYAEGREPSGSAIYNARLYGHHIPFLDQLASESSYPSRKKTIYEGNTDYLKEEVRPSSTGSGNNLTEAERKVYAGNVYEIIHDAGYLLTPETLTSEEIRAGLKGFYENKEVPENVKDAVRNTINVLGGEGNWGILTGMFATREQAANKTRRLYDDKILLDINKHLGGNAVSKKAFAGIVEKLTATMDEKGNLLYPSTSDVDALYKKSSNRENVNGPKDAFNIAATALRFDIDVTNLTPPDVAAVHRKLSEAHREANAVGTFGGYQSDLITAAITDANITEAGEKSKIVTKFAGLFGKSRFGIFKEMIEEHGIHYYNSTHGIFDGTGDTDEYKAFRSIMIKLSESREEGFVELYHASMMSIALSKMNDNKRAEEETNSMAPAQGAQMPVLPETSEGF